MLKSVCYNYFENLTFLDRFIILILLIIFFAGCNQNYTANSPYVGNYLTDFLALKIGNHIVKRVGVILSSLPKFWSIAQMKIFHSLQKNYERCRLAF